MSWVEWILSHALLRIAECNLTGLDQFWLDQGAGLLLTLLQINDISIKVDAGRVKAVRRGGGVQLLLCLARSLNKGLQLEATKVALAQLCVYASPCLQERAAGTLWGLSVSEANRYTQISYLIFLAQHDIFIVGANWFTNLFRCI
ncbi:hypothetical protein Hanom_Chr00s094032g01800251 [Helianthus anomalus]